MKFGREGLGGEGRCYNYFEWRKDKAAIEWPGGMEGLNGEGVWNTESPQSLCSGKGTNLGPWFSNKGRDYGWGVDDVFNGRERRKAKFERKIRVRLRIT